MKALKICSLFLVLIPFINKAQEVINLYSSAIPNAKENSIKETQPSGMFAAVTKPTLEIYLPEKEKSTGVAVVICPGGGYSVVVYRVKEFQLQKNLLKMELPRLFLSIGFRMILQ